MKEKDYEKAKEIFLNHRCSHFFMTRDDTYGEYKKYKISKKQEELWMQEYIDNVIKKISSEKDKSTISSIFSDWGDIVKRQKSEKNFSEMLSYFKKIKTEKTDSFTIIRLCEVTLNTLSFLSDTNKLKAGVAYSILRTLENLSENKITISDDYSMLLSVSNTFTEEALAKRVNKSIRKCNDILLNNENLRVDLENLL